MAAFTTTMSGMAEAIRKIAELNNKALIMGITQNEWDALKQDAKKCAETSTEMSMIQILDVYLRLRTQVEGATIRFYVKHGLVKFDALIPVPKEKITGIVNMGMV